MQYTKIYNNRRRGPMFDGSTETDEGLGIVTIDGRIDGDNKRHVIANVIITCKADIVVSWYDDSARNDDHVVRLIEETKTYLAKAYRHQA